MQVDEFISRNIGRLTRSHCLLTTASGVEDAGGLVLTVSGEEGFFFGSADTASKLRREVLLDIKRGIVQEFL
ncbi:Uncharacterised protein [Chlamydia trachomatis]|nr:Uncharacterised protein [Chlamydia trachomatis]